MLWLVLLIVQFHAIGVAAVLIRRAVSVARWSTPGNPYPYWQGWGVATEMLLSPYYDMGELTAVGTVEPMYFTDRLRVGLACGTLTSGCALGMWVLARRSKGNLAALMRGILYGLMPLAFMYTLQVVWVVIPEFIACLGRGPAQWWYGMRTPVGRTDGGAVWFGRAVNVACVLWLACWWWHAAAAIVPRSTHAARLIAISASLLTAALLFLWFLVIWNRWAML